MKTRYLVILATLTFLGFSAPAFAPPHGACTPWPSCKNDVDPPPSVDNSGLFTVEVFFEPLPVTGQAATASAALVNNVVGEDSDRRPSVGATDMDLNLDLMDTLVQLPGCTTVIGMPLGRFAISTAKGKHSELFTFVTANFFNFVASDGVTYGVSFVGDATIDDDANWLPAPGTSNSLMGDEVGLGVQSGPTKKGPCNGTITQNWKIEVTNEAPAP